MRHPVVALAFAVSLTVSIATDRWLHVGSTFQGYAALATFVLVFIAYWGFTFAYGAIYLIFGWHPMTGRRVCLYVGLTTQKPWVDNDGLKRYPRIEQHLIGSDFYGSTPKVWGDTVTDWKFAVETRYMISPLLKLLELVFIKLYRPLYNDKMNRGNRRRIDKRTAIAQRQGRDSRRMTDSLG